MSVGVGIVVLSGALLAVLLARAIHVLRSERSASRGSLPGTGHHRIEANYHSGGGGGGHSGSFTVPRDPQAYARRFVPKSSDKR